ncbi:MAG: hypothetical protein ACK5HR_01905 [Mycoplasmatales bacterium]
MNSIKETATKLINEKNDFVSFEEIIAGLDAQKISKSDLQAMIYTDLTSNGEFFFKDGTFNFKKNFTMYEISKLKSEYAISEIEEDLNEEEEEIINDNFNEEGEVVIDIDDIIEDNINLDDIDSE